jgi:hypothetical protein
VIQPQSDEEIREVVEGLRLLDPLLDVIWNARAKMISRGGYSVLGERTDAEYEGRWQVIRYQTATKLHDDRDYTVILTVAECDRSGKYPIMKDDGAYAPLGQWLVDYMKLWDAAQRAFNDAMDHQWREHEKIDALTHDRAEHQEALEKVYRESPNGSEYWMGGAQGRGSDAFNASMFGKGKRTVEPTAPLLPA